MFADSSSGWMPWVTISYAKDTLIIDLDDTLHEKRTRFYVGGPIDTVLKQVAITRFDTTIHFFDSLGWPLRIEKLRHRRQEIEYFQYTHTSSGVVQTAPDGLRNYYDTKGLLDSTIFSIMKQVFRYDARGREIEETTLFLGDRLLITKLLRSNNDTISQTLTEYLENGERIVRTRSRGPHDSTLGTFAVMHINSLGSPVQVAVSGDTSLRVGYKYDSAGRILYGSDGTDATWFSYGSKGEVVAYKRTHLDEPTEDFILRYYYQTDAR